MEDTERPLRKGDDDKFLISHVIMTILTCFEISKYFSDFLCASPPPIEII